MLDFADIVAQYPLQLQPFQRNIFREYLQYKILAAIFSSEYGRKLSFLGGTALRIIHNNTRFSEDLDFDNFELSEADFEALTMVVKKTLEANGYEIELKNVYKGAYRCYIRLPHILFEQKLSLIEEEKILIQIDTVPHHFVYKPETVIINKFDVFSPIRTTPADILLSQKIYAALNRKTAKGRDFFDIVFLLSNNKPNYVYLDKKLEIVNAEGLRKKLLQQTQDFDFDQLARDVRPFLFNPADDQKVRLFREFIQNAQLE
jgi:predicted nucleotidyltransferase component of viral defense system